jgi:hypothetical protein
LGLAVAAILTAACSSEPPPPDSAVAGSEAAYLQMVNGAREYSWTLEFLADQLVPDCMRAEGFEYWARSPVDGDVPALDADDEPADDLETPDIAIGRNNEYFNTLNPEERAAYGTALNGSFDAPRLEYETSDGTRGSAPTTGCVAEARLSILEPDDFLLVTTSMSEFEGLAFEILDEVVASPDYQEGTDELQTCLHEEGFELPDLAMDIVEQLDHLDQEPREIEAVRSCVEELELVDRYQLVKDQAAYDLLQDPRVEAAHQQWMERRDVIVQALNEQIAELFGS